MSKKTVDYDKMARKIAADRLRALHEPDFVLQPGPYVERPPHRDSTVTFNVPADVHAKAKARAAREEWPLSAVLRTLLNQWLNSAEPSLPPPESERVRAQKVRRKKQKSD